MSKCLTNLHEVFGDIIPKSELSLMLKNLEALQAKIKDPAAFRKAVDDLVTLTVGETAFKAKITVGQVSAAITLLDRFKDSDFNGDIKQAVMSTLEHNTSFANYTAHNVENLKAIHEVTYMQNFIMAIKENDLTEVLHNESLQEALFSTIATQKEYTGKLADKVNALAGIWRHMTDAQLADMNAAGIPVKKNPGYVARLVHDISKIEDSGKWLEDIFYKLDMKESLKDIELSDKIKSLEQINSHKGSLIELSGKNQIVDSLLEDLDKWKKDYNPFVLDETSSMLDIDQSISKSELMDRGQNALGTRLAKGRNYIFKDPSMEFAYRKQYSRHTSLGEMYDSMSRNNAKDLAFVKVFGPKPKETIKLFLDKLPITESDRLDFWNAWDRQTGRLYQDSGLSDRVAMFAKQVSSIAVLGNSALTAMSDSATVVHAFNTKGDTSFPIAILKTMLKGGQSLTEGVKANVSSDLSHHYQLAEYLMNEMNNVLIQDGAKMGGRMSWAVDKAMTMYGMKYANKAWMNAASRLFSDVILESNLSEDVLFSFKKVGLVEEDVSVLRKAMKEAGNPSPSAFYKMDSKLFENNRMKMSGETYKQELISRYNLFLIDNVRSATSSPSASTARKLSIGRPGTKGHAVSQVIGQFKQVALKGIYNAYGNAKFSAKSEAPWRDKPFAATYNVAKFAAVSTAIASIMLAAKQAKKAVEEGEDIDSAMDKIMDQYRENPETYFLDAFAASPAGNIIGDLLIDRKPQQSTGNKLRNIQDASTAMFVTPAAKVLWTPLAMTRALTAEGRNSHGEQFVKALNPIIPFQRTPYIVPIREAIKDINDGIIDSIDSMY